MGVGDADKANAGSSWWYLIGGTAKQKDEGVEVLHKIFDWRREDAVRERRGLEWRRGGTEEERHSGERRSLQRHHSISGLSQIVFKSLIDHREPRR